jgi:hypothetical protein
MRPFISPKFDHTLAHASLKIGKRVGELEEEVETWAEEGSQKG